MPLPGGPSDKAGNRYELMWTVRCMIDVMREQADSIRIEPFPPDGDGAEFILIRASRREHHQVKRQQSGKGHWTIRDMAGVLGHARRKLIDDPQANFVFVSMEAAAELRELCEAAPTASSFAEFKAAFLMAATRLGPFRNLCDVWGCDDEGAFALLPRITVETIGESLLRDMADALLAPLVGGVSASLRDVLALFALDSVHRTLTAHDLWRHLENRGHRPLNWARDATVTAAVSALNERYLALQPNIGGITIPRAEAKAIVEAFARSEAPARRVFLVGKAGVGKSSVTHAAVLAARDALNWPMLVLRVDRLDPTSETRAVGEQLRLPGSPASVLAALAQGRPALLMIDQLDAVSVTSGRNPQFFTTIAELLREAGAHSNLRVLIVCRDFDLRNDPRLRDLRQRDQSAPEIEVAPLSPETVRETVAALGLDPARLNQKQMRLLALPLHLAMFATVARTAAEAALSSGTAKDLFDAFWDTKKAGLAERRDSPAAWEAPLHTLAQAMSRDQSLSVSRGILRGVAGDADMLVSEHVLVADGSRLSFFHEAFFDYVFARFFIEDSVPLGTWLRDSEQHLFRRGQVRQILVYRRDDDFYGYLRDVGDLLTGAGIRVHIRQTAFAVLGAMDQPRAAEWALLEPLFDTPDFSLRRAARNALFRSPGWFTLLDELGVLEGWLDGGDDERREYALNLMRHCSGRWSDRVADLLAERFDRDVVWRKRVSWFIAGCRGLGASESLLQVLLAVLERGDISVLRDSQSGVWQILYSVPKHHPDWCATAIGVYLRRLMKEVTDQEPFDENSAYSMEILKDCAEGAPEGFVDAILPIVLELMERFANRSRPPPYMDRLWWDAANAIHQSHELSGALLINLSRALVELASTAPAAFTQAAERLAASDCESAHVLLMHAYAGAGAAVADDAGRYLVGHWRAFGIGERGGRHRAARELLEHAVAGMNEERLRALESFILSHFPESERFRDWGYAQHLLLDALPMDRLSVAARRRQGEWLRKFADRPFQPPRMTRGGWVRSPIGPEMAERMSDAHWLHAMARYADPNEMRWEDHGVRGGAEQLAHILQERAKVEPERFASLCLRMPPNAPESYVSAIVIGVASAALSGEALLALCRRAHEVPGRPCGRWIAGLIEGHAQQTLPAGVYDILRCYGEEDPDPLDDVWRKRVDGGGLYGGKPYFHGINTARGAVAEAVAALLFADPERLLPLKSLIERLITDPTVSVRSCAAGILIALLNSDETLAITAFFRLIDTDETILGTRLVEDFIRYAAYRDVAAMRPVLERMLDSADDTVAQAGGRQACLAALEHADAHPLAERALAGRVAHRKGAAEVYAQNITNTAVGAACGEGLRRLFRDADGDVRAEVCRMLWHLRDQDLFAYRDLLMDFVDSPAFPDAASQLLTRFDEAVAVPSDLLFTAVRSLAVATNADTARNLSHAASMALTLVIRGYRQTPDTDNELQARYLDLIDRLAGSDAHGFENALAAYDR